MEILWKDSFFIVSGGSPETMRKLCLSTKFPHQEIEWNYWILRSGRSVRSKKKVVSAPCKKDNFLGLSLVQRPSIRLLIPTWRKRNKTHIHFDYFDFEDITSPLQSLPICNLFVNIESCFHLLVNNQTLANC